MLSLIVLAFLLSQVQSYNYRDLSYAEIRERWLGYEQTYPDLFKIKHNFEDDPANGDIPVMCGSEKCDFFYAEVTNHKLRSTKKPTVLLVGGFHGNERLGPNIITELAQTILQHRDVSPIKELLDERLILLQPLVNPNGYYNNAREEQNQDQSVDINRDFSYNVIQESKIQCFQSKGARALANIYKKYLVQAGITFHGGDTVISWPWGSMNHLVDGNTQVAAESPDERVFTTLGGLMHNLAPGNAQLGIKAYTLGHMTDTVYALNGAYEDWAYAAGWEAKEVSKSCDGVPEKFYEGLEGSPRALIYLIETADEKSPADSTFGTSEVLDNMINQVTDDALRQWPPLYLGNELKGPYATGFGHINRNIMAALGLIDMVKPYLLLQNNALRIGGCKTIDKLVISQEGLQLIDLEGLPGIWSNGTFAIPLYTTEERSYTSIEKLRLSIAFSCDSEFLKQDKPDPSVSPQSYLLQSRYNTTINFNTPLTSITYQGLLNNTFKAPRPTIPHLAYQPLGDRFTHVYFVIVGLILLMLLLVLIYRWQCKVRTATVQQMELVNQQDFDA